MTKLSEAAARLAARERETGIVEPADPLPAYLQGYEGITCRQPKGGVEYFCEDADGEPIRLCGATCRWIMGGPKPPPHYYLVYMPDGEFVPLSFGPQTQAEVNKLGRGSRTIIRLGRDRSDHDEQTE